MVVSPEVVSLYLQPFLIPNGTSHFHKPDASEVNVMCGCQFGLCTSNTYAHSRTPKRCPTTTNLLETRHLDVSNVLVVLFLLPDQSCAVKYPATLNHVTCMREFPQLMIAICVIYLFIFLQLYSSSQCLINL